MPRLPSLFAAALCFVAMTGQAYEFATAWKGSRRWIGPDFWATRLQDWQLEDGEAVAVASPGRALHLLTTTASGLDGFSLDTNVRLAGKPRDPAEAVWAGFLLGVRGSLDDPRHALAGDVAGPRLPCGLRADGRLFVGQAETDAKVLLAGPASLHVEVEPRGSLARVVLRGEGKAGRAEVAMETPMAELAGGVALAVSGPEPGHDGKHPPAVWKFKGMKAAGPGLLARPGMAFGPVLWTQYTLSAGTLKLLAHFTPVEAKPVPVARLDLMAGTEWIAAASVPVDPRSCTALFRLRPWDGSRPVRYRVVLAWQGQDHEWGGTIRADPARETSLDVGVFASDAGYAFPMRRLVDQVMGQDPDLLFFAGGQIDAAYGGFGVQRTPLEDALLDYLGKLHRFGWTWRELLKDRPSVILPAGQDLCQPHLWGEGGRAAARPDATDNGEGGYAMPARWVDVVQRTQSGHLPDPVDPTPADQDIGVLFTAMDFGGLPVAILEDRKFRTGPATALKGLDRAKLTPAEADVADAGLLGKRQEMFLEMWAAGTASAPLRLVLAQTLLCQATTHAGPGLEPVGFDWDCGGWPRNKRDKVLSFLQGAPTLMLHGDGGPGLLVRQGVAAHDDGPLAFLVPGTANARPGAWWPSTPGEGQIDGAPSWTGRFTDPFGNRFTVLAAANPDRESARLDPAAVDPGILARARGSGYGLVRIDRARKELTFEMWHHPVAGSVPGLFDGFPVVVPFAR